MKRLLIRPGAIGDVILSLPALEAARADYTEVWAPRPVLPLIRFAGRTRAIADTGLDLVGVIEGASTAPLEAFDSIYSWYGFYRPEFRAAVRHLPFTFFPALPPPTEGIPRIPVPPAPLADFAVIHPFASGRHKRWPLENFRAVAEQLDVPVRWCAGPEEPLEHLIEPRTTLKTAVRSVVRFENLYELACWLASVRLYIGNDSGIAHLAAAVGVPVIAVFRSTDPLVWAPRGDHVTALRNPTVEDVLAATRTRIR